VKKKTPSPKKPDRTKLPADTVQDPEQVQSVAKGGKPPQNRIPNAKAAWAIFVRMRNDADSSALSRAKIMGQLDGNPPINPVKLKRIGLAGEPNVNWRETEAIIDQKATALWNMLTNVPTLIEATVDKTKIPVGVLPSVWEEVMGDAFTRIVMHEWDDFHWNVMLRNQEMLRFGVGPTFWRDEIDWRSESMQTSNILVPTKTKNKPSGLKICCVRGEISMLDLFDYIEDEKLAKEEGWNVPEIKRVIVERFKQQQGFKSIPGVSDFEQVQILMRNEDNGADMEFDDLHVAHMLSTELRKDIRGKVTHQIILEDEQGDEFLFEQEGRFENMQQAVCLFFYSVANGYYKGVRGLGHKLFPFGEVSNNFINRILSGAQLAATLLCQPQDSKSADNLNVIHHGPITLLPERINAVNTSFSPQVDKLSTARSMIQGIANNNYGIFRPSNEDVTAPEQTYGEVLIKQKNEAQYDTNEAAWYYIQWTVWLRETFRRLINPSYPVHAPGYQAAKRFRDLCQRGGIPEEFLKMEFWLVDATRAIGMGSVILAQEYTRELYGMSGSLDEIGRKNVIRDHIGVRFGYRKVDRYAPVANRNQIATADTSIAAMESQFLFQGTPIPVGTDQPHFLHIWQHFKDIDPLLQQVENLTAETNVEALAQALNTAMQHIAEHVKYLSTDPTRKKDIGQIITIMDRIAMELDRLAPIIRKRAKARQQQLADNQQTLQQGEQEITDPTLQVKMAKIRGELAIEQQKEMAREGLAERKFAHKARLDELKIQLRASQQGKESPQ
jgi:hypothetical protein